MNLSGFFSGLLHSTEQLVGNVARGAAKVVGNVTRPQPQQQRQAPKPAPKPAPKKPAPRVNLTALKNAIAGVHLQGIEQLTGKPVTVGSVVKGAGDMVNEGVVQPINRGQQALYKLETGQKINTRQFVSDAATTGLNFATLGRGKATLQGAKSLGTKVVQGLREGAVLGGASGAAQTFANPNATAKDYARSVATGAAVGAGAGAAAPVVGRGIRVAGRELKNAPKVIASEAGHIAVPGGAPNPKLPRPGMTYEQFSKAHAGDAKAMAAQLGVEVPKVPNPNRMLRKAFDATVSKMKAEAPPAVKPGKSAKVVAPPAPPAIEAPAMKSVGEIMAERGTIPPRPGVKNPGVIPPSVNPVASIDTNLTLPAPPVKFKIAPESKVGGVPNMSEAGLPPGTAPSRFDRRIAADPRASEQLTTSLTEGGHHQVLSNETTITAARNRVALSEDEALGYAVRGQGTEANATAMELLAKYLNAGDFERADELTRAVSPRFTKTGQQMQILAAYSRLTPAGAVRYAEAQLRKAADKSPKGAKAEARTGEVTTKLKTAQADVAKQVGEELQAKLDGVTSGSKPAGGTDTNVGGKSVSAEALTPEQRLAKRIKASEASKSKTPDPIMDMVNTLTKVAKQSLPEQAKKAQRNPMEFIGQAVKEGGEYERVYEAAKHIVAEKYKDNPAALEELDKYFTDHLQRPYAQRQLNQGVQNGLKGTDLSMLVRKHFSEVDATGEKLRQRLISEAGLSEQDATELSGDIMARFNELAAERKTSILNQMFKDRPTPQQKSAVDRIIELSNLGGLAREDLHPLIAEKLGVSSMTPQLASEITAMAEHIQSLPEGSVERGRAAAEMMAHIAKQIPSSATDKAIGVWKAGLLTGLKTQTGNAVGNAGNAAIKKMSDAPAALIDKAFSFFTKQRTKTFTVKGLGSGAKEGVGHGIKFLKTGVDERDLTTTKLDTKQLNYKNPVLNSYVNGVFKLMGAADRPGYYAALRNGMEDIALAAGKTKGLTGAELKQFTADFVKNPPDEAVETAVNAADKAVFANDTFLSDLAAGLRNKASKYPGGAAAIQIIMPFTKVPSSVITQVFDYTPTGTVKAIVGQILKGKFDQRAMSEAIGKSATGTIGFISAGVALANAGLLTGAYPKDPKEQQAWKAEGKTPNSILIAGKWRSLNYLAPIGPLFGMGQNIAQASKEGASAMGQVTAAATGGVQTALGQSFLQGVQGILDAVGDPSRYGLSTAKNMVASVIPTLVGDIAKATDPLQRQTNGIIDAVKAKIPGLRTNLAPQIDAFGNEIDRPNSAAGTLLDPVRSSKTTSTPLFTELDRLQAAGQGVYPTPDKTIQVGTTTVKLTPAQATAYNKAVGQAVQKLWGEITTSKEYQALADDKKKLALQGALDDVRSIQKVMTLRETSVNQGELSDKIKLTPRQIALANGDVQPADYIKVASGKALNPKSKYEQRLAAYKKDKADGKLTAAADLKAQASLAKEGITSKYDQEVLDFYSLSNTQKQAFFKADPEAAKKLYDQAKKLDSELTGATGSSSKFAKGGGLKVAGGGKGRKGKKPPKPRLPKLRLARVGRIPNLKIPRAKAKKSVGLKVASVKKLSLTA